MAYDDTNIFARILRGEIPCKKVHETEYALAFHDINPRAPVHVLVIPKFPAVTYDEFVAKAPAEAVAGYFRAMGEVVEKLGLVAPGYRVLANTGEHGHQEVQHLHFHVFGGRPLGPMIKRID
ncbi:MAG: histidine triad nucleotide-binding protein [Alphaproteobacteria bacterium]|nr:histidine triad nucleotide-binding protein [Alphaproteobacteria bacterium]